MNISTNAKGFTLVELMVTIAILAIIMAIAVPNYQAQINKSRRADAKATLMGEAQRLERCFTDKDTFKKCEPNDYKYNPAMQSYKGYYEISAEISASTYTLTVTASGEQANDLQCKTFTINQLGEKKANDSKANNNTTECWN